MKTGGRVLIRGRESHIFPLGFVSVGSGRAELASALWRQEEAKQTACTKGPSCAC